MKPGDSYVCALCGGTFETGWSEEEARAETEAIFGAVPAQEECDLVCDDCWQKIKPRGQN